MNGQHIKASYRLGSEFLVHPEKRDRRVIEAAFERLSDRSTTDAPEALHQFDDVEGGKSTDEYVQTLELSPPCPLYLGTYLYDEPDSCRKAGLSDRNQYMLELKNLYWHFGVAPPDDELPDFVPMMVDFARVSLGRDVRLAEPLRRYFLEEHFLPGLAGFRSKLDDYESPYALVIEGIEAVAEMDVARIDVPAWSPSDETPQEPPAEAAGCSSCGVALANSVGTDT